MPRSHDYFVSKFNEFNALIFNGRLPLPTIILTQANTFLGKCEYKRRRLPGGKEQRCDFHLRFNVRAELSDTLMEDVIIHEMIHYYIAYNNLKDTSAHGPLFRSMMNDINTRYGREIRVSHRLTDSTQAQLAGRRRRLHIVALIRFADGKFALKVLPRVLETMKHYYDVWIRQPGVVEIEMHITSHDYFNRYPSSGALKAYTCDDIGCVREALTDGVRLSPLPWL